MRDFLGSIKGSLGLDVYSFSVFHVFFEQYLSIGRDAAVLLAAAAAAVTLVTLLFTASVWASALVLLVLCMILVRGLTISAVLHAFVSVLLTCSPETSLSRKALFTMLSMLFWDGAAGPSPFFSEDVNQGHGHLYLILEAFGARRWTCWL